MNDFHLRAFSPPHSALTWILSFNFPPSRCCHCRCCPLQLNSDLAISKLAFSTSHKARDTNEVRNFKETKLIKIYFRYFYLNF